MMLWCNTTVYYGSGYIDLVGRMVEDHMNKAVSEVKALPNYAADGEVTNVILWSHVYM